MIKKDLLDKAHELLNEGKDKQEVYDVLQEQFPVRPKEIARLLRFLPTLELKRKYRKGHITVITAFLIMLGIQAYYFMAGFYEDVSNVTVFIICLVSFVIASGMRTYNGMFYLNAAMLAFIHLIGLLSPDRFSGMTWLLAVEMLVVITVVFSGVFMRIVMESRFLLEKTEVTDENGQKETIETVTFKK